MEIFCILIGIFPFSFRNYILILFMIIQKIIILTNLLVRFFLDISFFEGITFIRGSFHMFQDVAIKSFQFLNHVYKDGLILEGILISSRSSIRLKFRFSKKTSKFETIFHLIRHLLSKRQSNWEIV